MKNLLYKEFTLAKHPTMFFFPLFACMLLIPAYPYLVSFMYICLEIFFIFILGRETSDVLYTASLPIPKRDVVKARCVMILIIQLFQVLLSIPFAIHRVSGGCASERSGICKRRNREINYNRGIRRYGGGYASGVGDTIRFFNCF